MICRVHGTLEAIADGKAEVAIGTGMVYEVLLPSYAAARLGMSIGQPITLHTVHYFDGNAQTGAMTPRLAGFLTEADRAFFTLFTSVKGIGPRKALRAMAMSTAQIAAAIADRDTKTLQALPEVGKRTAESIVAELHGKADRFLAAPGNEQADSGGGAPTSASAPARSAAREAIEVLVMLGENRAQAMRWIDDVLIRQGKIDNAQTLVTEVLRLKTGA